MTSNDHRTHWSSYCEPLCHVHLVLTVVLQRTYNHTVSLKKVILIVQSHIASKWQGLDSSQICLTVHWLLVIMSTAQLLHQ